MFRQRICWKLSSQQRNRGLVEELAEACKTASLWILVIVRGAVVRIVLGVHTNVPWTISPAKPGDR